MAQWQREESHGPENNVQQYTKWTKTQMRDSGFSIVELMVSLGVVLLLIAGTVGVLTYQSGQAAYHIRAANAEQAIETVLLLIRNDLLQCGGPTGILWDASNSRLYIKYNGFLNFEAPESPPADNCTYSRSVFCPSDCVDSKCGVAWQKVDSDGTFTMTRFPLLIEYDVTGVRTAFLGALCINSSDCRTQLGASLLASVVEQSGSDDNINHSLIFTPQGSFTAGSYASPAIVYRVQSGKMLRNGVEILGGDIAVTSFGLNPTTTYPQCSVAVGYTWTPPWSMPSPVSKAGFQPISSTQTITVNILGGYLTRLGG